MKTIEPSKAKVPLMLNSLSKNKIGGLGNKPTVKPIVKETTEVQKKSKPNLSDPNVEYVNIEIHF